MAVTRQYIVTLDMPPKHREESLKKRGVRDNEVTQLQIDTNPLGWD